MPKPKRESDEAQSGAFIKAARELGCDESEEHFDEVLKKVAKHRHKLDHNKSQTTHSKPSRR